MEEAKKDMVVAPLLGNGRRDQFPLGLEPAYRSELVGKMAQIACTFYDTNFGAGQVLCRRRVGRLSAYCSVQGNKKGSALAR